MIPVRPLMIVMALAVLVGCSREEPKPIALPKRQQPAEDIVLTEIQRRRLAELQAALDKEELAAVRRTVAEMRKDAGGDWASVARPLREQALEALGWFGKAAYADLVGAIGDPDRELREEAYDLLEQVFAEVETDVEKAEILVALMAVAENPDRIETALNELDSMRNSVKVGTIRRILSTGTPRARQLMLNSLSEYTGDEVTGSERLDKWLQDNPDEDD